MNHTPPITISDPTWTTAQQPATAQRHRPVRLLSDVGDITRFASRAHFASWNGTAPLDASSGDNKP
jgi:hypothetical protein